MKHAVLPGFSLTGILCPAFLLKFHACSWSSGHSQLQREAHTSRCPPSAHRDRASCETLLKWDVTTQLPWFSIFCWVLCVPRALEKATKHLQPLSWHRLVRKYKRPYSRSEIHFGEGCHPWTQPVCKSSLSEGLSLHPWPWEWQPWSAPMEIQPTRHTIGINASPMSTTTAKCCRQRFCVLLNTLWLIDAYTHKSVCPNPVVTELPLLGPFAVHSERGEPHTGNYTLGHRFRRLEDGNEKAYVELCGCSPSN